MTRPSILKAGESYTFSRYFELPFTLEDILAELDCTVVRAAIALPRYLELIHLEYLNRYLERSRNHIELTNEASRREALISPILLEACDITNNRLNIEYAVFVSDYLKGTLDYYIAATQNLLVIEAKQSDLVRGFTQLAVEMIALDRWTRSECPILYGAVTTGEDWRFGQFDRASRQITQDLNLYRVPDNLEDLLRILIGILMNG